MTNRASEVPPVVARAVTGHASQSAYAGYGGREAARRARAAAKRREREALAQGSVERLRIEEAAWTVAVPTTRFPRSGTLRDCGVLGRTRSRANRTRGPEPAGKPQAERQECLFWPAAQLEAGTAVPGGRCARLTLAAKFSIAKFGVGIQMPKSDCESAWQKIAPTTSSFPLRASRQARCKSRQKTGAALRTATASAALQRARNPSPSAGM